MINEYRPAGRGSLWVLAFFIFICACGSSTSEEAARDSVVRALDGFAEELEEDPPTDAAGLHSRIQSHLEAHPDFFGSAVALLDAEGIVTASPYVHRSGDGFEALDLATPDYHIDEQEWLATPRDAKEAVWTGPYFDAGGGEIWMVTRSVPVTRDGAVVLVVTTDLPVDAPEDPQAFQGTWKLIAGETDGKALPEKELEGGMLIIKGDRYTVTLPGGETMTGVQKLDPAKRPKTIDVTDATGPNEGETSLGIYELEGGEYRVVFAPPGKDRPTEFATVPDSGQWLHVWKGVKR